VAGGQPVFIGEQVSKSAESTMIGIDVGATKIAVVLVTTSGRVLAAKRENTLSDQGAERVIMKITGLTNELIQISNGIRDHSPSDLLGIGIGIPGQVNITTGVVRQAVNLGWDEVPLVSQIQKGLVQEVPIAIDTDANASTLGEFYFGVARGCGDFVFLSIGSGLGAGLFVNGSLVTGTSWKAAELGHISLDTAGLPCKCGLRGCAETIVSGPGLLYLVEILLKEKQLKSQLSRVITLTPADVISAARRGDPLALNAFSEMGRCLGIVIAICASVTNPGKVIIGGGLGIACFDLLLCPVEEEISRRLLPSLYSHMKIVPSQLRNSAIGAACLVLNQGQGDKMRQALHRKDNGK
jgi:glucokinase